MPSKCMARRAHKNNFEMLICGSANMWGREGAAQRQHHDTSGLASVVSRGLVAICIACFTPDEASLRFTASIRPHRCAKPVAQACRPAAPAHLAQ